MNRFKGKTALVTGGMGALGAAIARRLAQEGAQVVVTDLKAPSREALDALFPNIDRLHGALLDVIDPESWDAALTDLMRRFGRLNVVVNNAGVISPEARPFDAIDPLEWKRVFSVNVDGVFHGTQAALRMMKKAPAGGVIINIGSVTGYIGSKDNGAYGASKAAVRNLTKQAALSAARMGYGVRVNAVHPGYVWTPFVERRLVEQFGSIEAAKKAVAALNPMGRIVGTEDVAAAVAFLASDDARMMTGADLVVDGGRLLQ